MPATTPTAPPNPPTLVDSFFALTVDDLKWYAAVVANKLPTRKGELVVLLVKTLTDEHELRELWKRLTVVQQQVVAEVVHRLGGRYDATIITAKYPEAAEPLSHYHYGYFYAFGAGRKKQEASPYDLFFAYNDEYGRAIPSDLAARLRAIAPAPPPLELRASDEPPVVRPTRKQPEPAQVLISSTERPVFHDLAATLFLIQQGKIAVSATTKMPTLPSLRQLRQRLLVGDYFEDEEYGRAEDAIRPLALIMIVQAAKWATPGGAAGKLELTRSGQAVIAGPLEARHVREAWDRWLKSDLLDELSRIRTIKGQQSKATRLTKPAERRAKLQSVLRACPIGRWVELDEFFRYMRAEAQAPAVERSNTSGLHLGSSVEYGWLGYREINYWDIVIGSYLRAVLWEYAATLGLIDIAYTRPEETPHSFGTFYGLDDYDYLSRYDGLLGFRITDLGAYVLGLADSYTPPAAVPEEGPPLLAVLPNLDLVVTDARRMMLNDRAFLERIGIPQSQDVYRLSREHLLEAAEHGLDLQQVKAFLLAKSGLEEAALPQTVRVFFEDLQSRMAALRDGGRMLVLHGDDPYLLTELANSSDLRAIVRLGTLDGQTVLLVPEEREAAVRRQLRKLGYVPKKS